MKLNQEAVNSLKEGFNRRAKILRLQSYAVLAAIVLSIVFGVYFFIIADRLTKRESIRSEFAAIYPDVLESLSTSHSTLDAIKWQVDTLRGEVNWISYQNGQLSEVTDTIWHQVTKILWRDYALKNEKYYDSISSRMATTFIKLENIVRSHQNRDSVFQNNMLLLDTGINFYSKELTRVLDQVEQGVDKISTKTESSSNQILSTTVTRTGTVLLLIFFVQILVTLYRYFVRLSVYYDARADALQVISKSENIDSAVLERIVEILTPKEITFGKEPRSPAQDAIELAKELYKGKNGN